MYNIYQDGKCVAQTAEKSYTLSGLQADTSYTLGVSKVEGGKESAVIEVVARTDSEQVVPLPHSLEVIDKGDSHITVAWDSGVPIGEGVFNLYLDDEPVVQDLKVREYTIKKLEPSTEYKICLCGVDASGNETPKTTIRETTNAKVEVDEPAAPLDLINLINNGSFEMFDNVYPDGFENGREAAGEEGPTGLITSANEEWATDGEQSLEMAVSPEAKEAAQILVQRIKVSTGYYVAALDYKMPAPTVVEAEGAEIKYKHALALHALNHSEEVYGGEGVMQLATNIIGTQDVNVVVNLYIADYGEVYDAKAVVDALRLYKVSKEMHDYINAGKMSDERFKEVFPYVDSVIVDPQNKPTEDVSMYHIGGGYYELPSGDKVRGKEAAIKRLNGVAD